MGSINNMINRFVAFTLKRALFAKIYLNLITSNKNKRILLLGTEDFGNLGDQHIAYSQIQFLRYYFPEYSIVELPASVYYQKIDLVEKFIKEDDVIALHGGGNMGDAYPFSENLRRNVIERFPLHVKFIFPQTIYYKNIENLSKAVSFYNKSNNVMIFCREKYSYEYARNNFDCESYLVPDIVLFSRWKSQKKRSGILVCLRNDLEKNKKIDKSKIVTISKHYNEEVHVTDTQLPFNISILSRKRYLGNFLKVISSHELVITDRLHGMVFCAISNTPCIVLPNYNYKVIGVQNWISSCRSVRYIDAENETMYYEISHTIKNLIEEKTNFDQMDLLTSEYDKMAGIIKDYYSRNSSGGKNAG